VLTLAAGVAVRKAIAHATGFFAELKWPNDLMVGGRKLAGILSEGLAIGTPHQAVLVGIGLNVLAVSHPGDIATRATSLQAELGEPVERGPVLEELLVTIPQVYHELSCGNVDDILHSWRAASPSAVGHQVQWDDSRGVHRGTTAGIDATGALLVTTGSGVERVLAGELLWVM
jgi:BirA family biotin operon repressor/biotin-[acetyl-CoA-carboxylase] ligase